MSLDQEFNSYTAINDEMLDSPARVENLDIKPLRISIVQDYWHGSKELQIQALTQAVEIAMEFNPDLIAFNELTLYPYACTEMNSGESKFHPEPLIGGPSYEFAAAMAKLSRANILISLYEEAEESGELGFNTVLIVSPNGEIISRTRKTHIPMGEGYFEKSYFSPGEDGTPTATIGEVLIGAPTCWDQWFPELARIYALNNADLLIYPTAIGSEPDHQDFDTQPLWQAVMVGNAIANGLFIAAVNRVGIENCNIFYGKSFIVDPYGRIILQADRTERAVLTADLDIQQRSDWLDLFTFFKDRRPQMYGELIEEFELDSDETE